MIPSYPLEVLRFLAARHARLPAFHFRSPQLHWRPVLVKWTVDLAGKLRLSLTVSHLAVKLLDYFMDKHSIRGAKIYLVCACCLLLAAKMESNKRAIPTVSDLSIHVDGGQFAKKDYASIEMMIMESCGWNLIYPTAAEFSQVLLDTAQVSGNVSAWVEYFLDGALKVGDN